MSNPDPYDIAKQIDEYAAKFPIIKDKNISLIVWGYGENAIMPYSSLETVELTFEDMSFPVPRDYGQYLSNIYGDYMSLPPKDQRIPHVVQAYWI